MKIEKSDRINKIIRIKFTFGGKKNFRIGNIPFPGFLERTSDIERGSGLQPRQLIVLAFTIKL